MAGTPACPPTAGAQRSRHAGRTLTEIASTLAKSLDGGAAVHGDGNVVVNGLAPIETAGPGDLTHLSGRAYRRFLPTTGAAAVLLRAGDVARCPAAAVVVANPYLAFALVSQLFDDAPTPPPGVDAAAQVHATARIHPLASVAAGAAVAANASIGAGAQIWPCAYVGEDVRVGADTVIHSNATLYRNVRVGERCVIHAGAVIGADGFGFAPDERGRMRAIAQLGGVVMGDDVVVGAATTIDRGTLTDTVIRDGVKIDNQVQIGHNCDIGEHTVLCGQVGLAGSTRIGRHCMLGGGAGVAGEHPIEICDGVHVGAVTAVTRSIGEPGVYLGAVLHNTAARWKRTALRLAELDEMAKRLGRLEAEVRRTGEPSPPSGRPASADRQAPGEGSTS